MKTTIELPDELLREAKATAAREGKSLKEVFTNALREHLSRPDEATPGEEEWRVVFGAGDAAEIRSVDEVVAEELERIELESWS